MLVNGQKTPIISSSFLQRQISSKVASLRRIDCAWRLDQKTARAPPRVPLLKDIPFSGRAFAQERVVAQSSWLSSPPRVVRSDGYSGSEQTCVNLKDYALLRSTCLLVAILSPQKVQSEQLAPAQVNSKRAMSAKMQLFSIQICSIAERVATAPLGLGSLKSSSFVDPFP